METSLSPALIDPPQKKLSARQQSAADHKKMENEHGTRAGAKKPGFGWILLVLIVVGGGFAGLFYLGYVPSMKQRTTNTAAAEKVKNAPLRVSIIKPKKAEAVVKLQLPGEIHAERETAIYARTSGYLKEWKADIGDHVKAGATLAVVDSPEVDMQMEQAKAALKQSEAMKQQSIAARDLAKAQRTQAQTALGSAKAKLELASLTLKRYESLRNSSSINDEMISEKYADDKSAKSNLNSTQAAIETSEAAVSSAESAIGVADANITMAQTAIKRLEVLQSFQTVTAPFAGTITQRQTEVGSLVNAGSVSSQSLFTLAATDVVRVYLDVPQSAAPDVKDGQVVDLILREYPNKKFQGEVARTTRSIDTASRTLRVEVRVKNESGELLRGMYTQVKLNVVNTTPPLLLPGSALIINADGTQVAVMQPDGRVHFKKVTIEGDYGSSVGISQGLEEQDLVVANPSERLLEGSQVVPAEQKTAEAAKSETPAKPAAK